MFTETEILDIRQLYFAVAHSYPTFQRNLYMTPLTTNTRTQTSFGHLAPKSFNLITENLKTLTVFYHGSRFAELITSLRLNSKEI